MRRVQAGLAAVVASLALPAAAVAAPDVITNPSWVDKPNAQAIQRFYPPQARNEGVNGQATIECTVELDQTLSHCAVLSETPLGYGFGEATLAASTLFRMKPKTVNGVPVAGARVSVPLNWSLGATAYPVLEDVDLDQAAACFAIYFVAIETNLAKEDDLPAVQLFQWAGLAVGKVTLTSSDVSAIDAKMRAAIMPARLRASANPELFRAEINDCDRAMRRLYRVPGEPNSGG